MVPAVQEDQLLLGYLVPLVFQDFLFVLVTQAHLVTLACPVCRVHLLKVVFKHIKRNNDVVQNYVM